MAMADLFAVEMLLAAFAGGAFGAAVGALPSFTLAGAMVVVGEAYALLSRSLGADPAVDLTQSVGFGVVLGPHVAFGGGAAAVALAARRGYLDADFEYHDAKLVTRGLGARPDLLAVGGAFGVLGYWIATASASLSVPVDPVALGVVGSAFVHRLVLGYPLVGRASGGTLDMSPFERRERRDDAPSGGEVAADGGESATDGRFAVEPWLPYQYRWSHVTTLGVVVGILGAYVAYVTGSAFLAFGISVAALVFLNADAAEIPVTHHVTLPASTVVLAMAGADGARMAPDAIASTLPAWQALVAGAVVGVAGALAGELLQRILYAHADTHLDPPAASIVVTTFAVAVLAMAGVLPSAAWVPHP